MPEETITCDDKDHPWFNHIIEIINSQTKKSIQGLLQK